MINFYAIKNKIINSFNLPFSEENDAKAIYSVRVMINQMKEPNIIASDFELYRVGAFNCEFGFFSLDADLPVCLVDDLSSLLVKKEEASH